MRHIFFGLILWTILIDSSSAQSQQPPIWFSSWGLSDWFSGWSLSDKIAAIASLVAFLQFFALFATVRVIMSTARRQLRAYISVEPCGINPYVGRSYVVGHFRIRNVGNIPARNVSIFSSVEMDDNGERKTFAVSEAKRTKTALQPRATMEFGSDKGWDLPVTAKVRNEPLEVDGYLYVWGQVTYTDEFNTVGWTNFCHRYPCAMFGKEGVGPHSIDRKFARIHEGGGNEAD